MPIEKGEYFNNKDVFIDYPFEKVMFRWDHQAKQIYRRFYGKTEDPVTIPSGSRLFNDALRFGDEVDKEKYLKGDVKK